MKAVIFDMDGVIFDSERIVYEGWKELSEKYGFKDLDTVYMKCIGVNNVMCKQIYLDFYGEDFPYDKYRQERSDNYHERYSGGRLPMKPGVKELLDYLKENNYQIAIASSTRTALVEEQIRDAGLLDYFSAIVGGDQVEKSKPEPDIFLRAADLLEVDPKEAYVIEDSYNGIRAAKAANMCPIMVPDMIDADEEMRETAWMICGDLVEVIRAISLEMDVPLDQRK